MGTDRRREAQLLGLLLCAITQVWCQSCSGSTCHCPPTAPRCPAGVPLIADSCGCCRVCARREGEACSERRPCDGQRGLRCDYSASFPQGPGLCVGENELGCEVDGRRLEEGQVFQPSCAQLCRCLGGGVTCVPLCSEALQSPAHLNCPNPQLVRPPGRCCKEWLCVDVLDNTLSSDPSAAVSRRGDYGGGPSAPPSGSLSNCIAWTSAWSPCSHSCGPGVSSRSSSRNPDCSLRTETRLCQVRPCQARLQGPRGLPSGVCESSFSLPVSVQLEYQGCWSVRAYRPRFCGLACPEGHCCSPSLTRTTPVLFLCPQGRLIPQQVMMIQSCSCSVAACLQPAGPRGLQHWL